MEKFSVLWCFLTHFYYLWLCVIQSDCQRGSMRTINASSPSCFLMCVCGGTYRRWKNLQDDSFPSFFIYFLMAGNEFCRILYFLSPWWSVDPLASPVLHLENSDTSALNSLRSTGREMLVPSRSLMSSPTCVWSPAAGSRVHMFFTSAMVIFGSLKSGFAGSGNPFVDLLVGKKERK